MFYILPNDPRKSNPLIQRFFRENIGASQEMLGIRRRPQMPRDLLGTALIASVRLSWRGPQNLAGVIGYNIYQNNQTNLIQNMPATQYPSSSSQGSNISAGGPPTINFTVSGLVTGTAYGFWISCYTSLLESVKVPVIATPN
jgi:hypothetical protein